MTYLALQVGTQLMVMCLVTMNAGSEGVSGSITSTGTTSLEIQIYTFLELGAPLTAQGDIDIIVGTGDSGEGGNIYVTAGESTHAAKTGGFIQILGGMGVLEMDPTMAVMVVLFIYMAVKQPVEAQMI